MRTRSAIERPRWRRAEADTNPKFQPTPSPKRAGIRIDAWAVSAVEARRHDANRTNPPARIMRRGPPRSTSQPVIGAIANIPRVWAIMTHPTAPRSPPALRMCTGVIVMTRTITDWPTTRATNESTTVGRRRIDPSDRSPGWATSSRSMAGSSSTASVSGSGRSATAMTRAAMAKPTTARPSGPASSVHPAARAQEPVGSMSSGPTTAPMVEAHTMRLMAAPRRDSFRRSPAA